MIYFYLSRILIKCHSAENKLRTFVEEEEEEEEEEEADSTGEDGDEVDTQDTQVTLVTLVIGHIGAIQSRREPSSGKFRPKQPLLQTQCLQ
jgi:hypothetical protein